MRGRRVLGQNQCMFLGLNMVQNLGRDMVWGLDTGWRCGWAPGRYGGLERGWG